MVGAHGNPAGVGAQVVDAVGVGLAQVRVDEVVDLDLFGIDRPGATLARRCGRARRVLLLGVHADHWIARSEVFTGLVVEVGELRVASPGRLVGTLRWPGTPRATRTCPARLFNRGSAVVTEPRPVQRAVYVFRSTGTQRRIVQLPGTARLSTTTTPPGAGNVLLDKQLMTVDNHPGSKYADRIYVTWTTFAADGTAYIYEAYSNDYGEIFSDPVLVSGDSDLCGNTFGVPTPQGRCNENQFSQPFTAPGRHALRRVGQLQQRRERQRQPQPDAAGPLDQRRAELPSAGQGRRLLRAARLRHLPGRRL